jgi:metal-responsive CopG/Arc/MetJ family transcriptional regulator
MKAIQITVDERLLTALDRALKGGRRQRSAFIRQSIANELKRTRQRTLEEADRRGYLEMPVGPDEFDVDPGKLAWGGDWQPGKPRRRRA